MLLIIKSAFRFNRRFLVTFISSEVPNSSWHIKYNLVSWFKINCLKKELRRVRGINSRPLKLFSQSLTTMKFILAINSNKLIIRNDISGASPREDGVPGRRVETWCHHHARQATSTVASSDRMTIMEINLGTTRLYFLFGYLHIWRYPWLSK